MRVVRWWLVSLVILEIFVRSPLRWWGVISLLHLIQPFWYLPVVPLALVAGLRRRWKIVGLAGVIAGIWLWQYAPFWFNSTLKQPTDLRVLTWNVSGWNLNIGDIDRVIEAEQPDLFVLQEVDEGLRQPLIAHFIQRYPYFEIRLPTDQWSQPDDLVLFSRFPYQSSALDCHYWQCYRSAVDVNVNGTILSVVNVHIEHSPLTFHTLDDAKEQGVIRQLLEDTRNWQQPLLIMGDFNTSDRQDGYTLLAQRWHDTWRERGRGLGMTWTPWRGVLPPLLRIDYIWHSEHLTGLNMHSGRGVSDHRYLVANFSMVNSK